MVKMMENPIKMGWFGGTTTFGNIHINSIIHLSDDSQKFDQSLRKAGERLRFKKVSGGGAWQCLLEMARNSGMINDVSGDI